MIRKLGLEWLARLIREPRRWRRQLVLPVFAALVAKEAVMRRFGRRNR
jgi:N-acetylglucosaminyldiphosphoundecaprenol N-acetyl-beta-D-mannosaminyltransferase